MVPFLSMAEPRYTPTARSDLFWAVLGANARARRRNQKRWLYFGLNGSKNDSKGSFCLCKSPLLVVSTPQNPDRWLGPRFFYTNVFDDMLRKTYLARCAASLTHLDIPIEWAQCQCSGATGGGGGGRLADYYTPLPINQASNMHFTGAFCP